MPQQDPQLEERILVTLYNMLDLVGVTEAPGKDIFALYDLIQQRFWERLETELRPALDEQFEAELSRYRQIQQEELTRFRTDLREHLERQIAEQLYDSDAGRQDVETARDIIVNRIKEDPEVYHELIAQRPKRWSQRTSSMTGVG